MALIAPAAFAVAATAPTSPAVADPSRGLVAQATCSDGNSYDVVVAGNGDYLPAHVLTSTQVVKPVAFGPFTTTVTDRGGNVISTETNEAMAQGGGTSPRTIARPTSTALSASGSSHRRV